MDFTAVWSMVASPFAAKGFGKWLISSAPEGLCKLLTLFGDVTGAYMYTAGEPAWAGLRCAGLSAGWRGACARSELLSPLLLLTSTVHSWRRLLPVLALLGLQLGINSVLYLTSFG